MTTRVQCGADPQCKVPAPPEIGICHCHAKQAAKAVATLHKLSRVDQARRAWPRQPDKEPEP